MYPSSANACSIASTVTLESNFLREPGQAEATDFSCFFVFGDLVACSRIHLRCERSFPIGVLIEHRRDSVRPTLRAIEVLPHLQLTQKSERY